MLGVLFDAERAIVIDRTQNIRGVIDSWGKLFEDCELAGRTRKTGAELDCLQLSAAAMWPVVERVKIQSRIQTIQGDYELKCELKRENGRAWSVCSGLVWGKQRVRSRSHRIASHRNVEAGHLPPHLPSQQFLASGHPHFLHLRALAISLSLLSIVAH